MSVSAFIVSISAEFVQNSSRTSKAKIAYLLYVMLLCRYISYYYLFGYILFDLFCKDTKKNGLGEKVPSYRHKKAHTVHFPLHPASHPQ